MDELLDSYYDMYGCTVTREVFPYAERIRYRINEAVDTEEVKKNIEKGAKKAADPKFTRKDVEQLHDKRRETVKKLVKEEVDTIIAYLVDNNFAKTEKAARNIMEAMSDDWLESIIESLLTEAPYEIVHHGSTVDGTRVGPSEPKVVSKKPIEDFKAARRKAERMNQKYGATAYTARRIS